jgi:hypothetical protein
MSTFDPNGKKFIKHVQKRQLNKKKKLVQKRRPNETTTRFHHNISPFDWKTKFLHKFQIYLFTTKYIKHPRALYGTFD